MNSYAEGVKTLAAAIAPVSNETVGVNALHIGLQTLLKIMQHSRNSPTSQVSSGQLLGLDAGNGVLEVTDTFPFAPRIQDEIEQEEYQLDMMKSLRDINVDHSIIGWYQTCSIDGFVNMGIIDSQLNYQSTIGNSILLIYDSFKSADSCPSIRALRVKDTFSAIFLDRRTKNISSAVESGIFDEIPIFVCLSALDRILISQMYSQNNLPPASPVSTPDIELLRLGFECEGLITATEDLLSETSRINYNLRSATKQQQTLATQLQRLRAENSQRIEAGEELIPVSSVFANFRSMSEPVRLSCFISFCNLRYLIYDASR